VLKGRLKYFALPFFLLGIILIVFLQFTSGRSINNLISSNRRLLDELKVQTDLQRLESNIVTAESDVRWIIITEDSIHLPEVKQEINNIRTDIRKLRSQVANTNTNALMEELEKMVEKKNQFNHHILNVYQQQGKAAAERVIKTNRGKLMRDTIIMFTNILDSTRRSELAAITRSIDNIGKRALSWGLILAIVAGLTIIIAFWHFVSRGQEQSRMINVLDISEKKVKEAARVQEQFMANMSHEIRTPMNAILGFTNLLQKTDLNNVQKQYIDNIQSSGENLLTIVNDILDLSKIEEGMMGIEEVPFSLRGLMHSVETMFKEKARRKHLYVDVNIEDSIPDTLNGDPTRLTQILVNLLGNAIKFTTCGGINIDITMVERDKKDVQLQFNIKDSGIGIAPEKQKNIFDRFQQAEAETTRRYGGTGLGLSIVKQLIDLQQGKIEVKSEMEKGTEFIFQIPYTISFENIEGKEISYAPAEDKQLTSTKILVAEDNVMNQQLIKHLLTSWNLNFTLVSNGAEVINNLQNKDYDLILMDIQMPEVDGYVATEKIRNDLKSDVAIIAMTAHAMAGEREKCISYGMNDYISKPIKEAELYRLIKKYGKPLEDSNGENGNGKENGNGSVIDLSYLQDLSSGNKDFENQIIRQFIKQVPEEIISLEQAIHQKDFVAMRSLAHNMKSSVSYLGLMHELGPMLQEIENQAVNETDLSIIRACFDSIEFTCRQAVDEAKKLVGQS
jgi:signal transduction histidine kinase/DNA-binding response OmpR family regulator